MPSLYENALKVFLLIASAQGVITCGIYFVSGLFLPQVFGSTYAYMPQWVRLLVALVTAFLLGNVLMANAFANYSPALTAPMTIFSIVVMQIVFAVWIFHLTPSPWLILATLAAAASCMWVSYLLNQKPV